MAIGRREVLLSGAAAGLAAAATGFSASSSWADPRFSAGPFWEVAADERFRRVVRPGAPVWTRTGFVTENGNPGLQFA
jgi:hypothetical protein